ncbi:MAG: HPF/RaiA family ribosome-associated protein [Gemmatimonadaceae bacterium]
MARSGGRSSDKKSRQRLERRETFPSSIPKAEKRGVGRTTTSETPLHVRARGVELDDATREYFHERVGFKLGKFALNLTRIGIGVENVAGPKGAPAFAVRFKVILPGAREVVITTTDAGVRPAFDSAVDVTERAVRRLLERGQTVRTRRSS